MEIKKQIISDFIDEELTTLATSLNNYLTIDGKKLNTRAEYDIIQQDIDNFIEDNNSKRFIAMPGLRGVGKTTILYQMYDYLLNEKNIPYTQILYISCERFNNLVDCNIREIVDIYLKNYHDAKLRTLDKKIFLLIDESQYDKNWAISGKIIYDSTNNIFMIFTGSSALNLEYNADAARRLQKNYITPLNYGEHIKLKYNYTTTNISNSIQELIFEGKIDNAIKCENEINNTLIKLDNYKSTDWDEYLKYGGFPILFENKEPGDISKNLVDMVKKIINTDMLNIKNFSAENQAIANRILRFLALQNAGDISQNKLSKNLNTSSSNIRNILDILEKTHIIFHCNPYGTSSKRIKKAWKYYFATSSIKHALVSEMGNSIKKTEQYEGILLENLVASSLFNVYCQENIYFDLYYDANKEGNVDFLIRKAFENPIPIEVDHGKKDKRQIFEAIKNYGSEYGIIVSNEAKNIKKEDNVISIHPRTFAFL